MIQLDGHYVSLAVRAAGTEIHDLPEAVDHGARNWRFSLREKYLMLVRPTKIEVE
jgi:hypothetical protein